MLPVSLRTRCSSTMRWAIHGEVGHHVVGAEKLAHCLEQVGEFTGGVGHDVLVGALGIKAPMPGVLEGGNLGG